MKLSFFKVTFVFIALFLISCCWLQGANRLVVGKDIAIAAMPMNEVATTTTLLAMHRHHRTSGVRHNAHRAYRASHPVRSRPAYRHHNSVRRNHHRPVHRYHHRPWRHYWRPYWGPWPWWGWGYVYPFGVYYYPGWGWWYYPTFGGSYYGWWRCWYFDRWGYWYYPGLHFSAYIASRADRIVYVDNDSDDDLYYAVYSRRRIGDVYYLYRIDEPLLIERRRAVKVYVPRSNENDYMVIAEKNDEKLPKRMHHDKSGKLVQTQPEDPGHKRAVRAMESPEKIKVEELSKKDKRELKKMKRKLREKDKKIQELSAEIEAIKDPEAEARQKGLRRVDAVKENASVATDKEGAPRIGVDVD